MTGLETGNDSVDLGSKGCDSKNRTRLRIFTSLMPPLL